MVAIKNGFLLNVLGLTDQYVNSVFLSFDGEYTKKLGIVVSHLTCACEFASLCEYVSVCECLCVSVCV